MATLHSGNALRIAELLGQAKRALIEAEQVAASDVNSGTRLPAALARLAGECEYQQQQMRKKVAA